MMNRRGFLGALTAGLAFLGAMWPRRRVTATETETVLSAGVNRAEARWTEEYLAPMGEDHLCHPVGAAVEVLAPEKWGEWKAGDVWMNLDTRETIYVRWVNAWRFQNVPEEGLVAVMRGAGNSPRGPIAVQDLLVRVGNDGRDCDVT